MDYIGWAEEHLHYKTKAIYDGETVIALGFCKCHAHEYVGIADSVEEAIEKISHKYYKLHSEERVELETELKLFGREKE